jgi:flagellar protein FliJ
MASRQQTMLTRLHRVRTLQLNLTMADEARAQERVASEHQLSHRIGQLTPTPAATASAASLMANAHFRHRLLESADAAAARIRAAEQRAAHAGEQTKAAKRDQTAVEKLMDRARMAAIRAEMRALEDMPAAGGASRRNRHDPC